MKRLFQWTAVLVFAAVPVFAQETAPASEPPSVALETDDQKMSYIFGTNLGNSLKELPLKLDEQAFLRGVRDIVAGSEPALDQTEIQAIMLSFTEKVRAEQTKRQEVIDAKRAEELPANLKLLEDFNADAALKSTTSGLKYRMVREGEGDAPLSSDTVEVNYKGMLTDGTVFDSSYDRGQSITFGLGQVIPGWGEALQLMKEGGKLEVLIPGNLAYGANPHPESKIPPNATLFFVIELINVL
jgi:FKBP-type peptidyl-prolyl cis-trans isomerase